VTRRDDVEESNIQLLAASVCHFGRTRQISFVHILLGRLIPGRFKRSGKSNEITVAFVGAATGSTSLPTEATLFQNFPNPFVGTTAIAYALPVSQHVTLKVFDILGREVMALVNEEQSPGFKSVEFDAGKLPSGVYTYRLIVGGGSDKGFVSAKKTVLLK
jgi:hypothetical protein